VEDFVSAVDASFFGYPEIGGAGIVNDLECLGGCSDLYFSVVLGVGVVFDDFVFFGVDVVVGRTECSCGTNGVWLLWVYE